MTSAPGSTKSTPAARPPRMPCRSQPIYVASFCASGPGKSTQKLSACRKRLSSSHFFSSTTTRCMIAICPAGPPKLMKPSFSQKRSASANETPRLGLELACRDRVLEVVRIEAVEALSAVLRLRVHQEADRGSARAGQLDVVRLVVGEPVHLPGAEELLPHWRHDGIGERGRLRLLFQHHLAHVRRVDRNPAVADEENFGAAMLRFGDVRRAGAEAAVAELALRHAQAVDVARRNVHRTAKADHQRVQIGALARQVAALEHCL